MSSHIAIAKVGAVHGLKGWLKLRALTEDPNAVFRYQPWLIQHGDHYQTLVCDAHRVHPQGFLVHFEGLDSPEHAAYLTNQWVYGIASQLPKLSAGEYYWQQLIGLQVKNLEGVELGRVASLMETGANDVMLIEGEKSHCVPYLPHQVIKEIDVAAATMLVDWPAEL